MECLIEILVELVGGVFELILEEAPRPVKIALGVILALALGALAVWLISLLPSPAQKIVIALLLLGAFVAVFIVLTKKNKKK